MDGSTHPENTGVAAFPGGVNDPFAVDQSPSNMDHDPDSPGDSAASQAQKRAHDEAAVDIVANDSKRIHVDEEDDENNDGADDMDLDTLMAQLQQHAEQATSGTATDLTADPSQGLEHLDKVSGGEGSKDAEGRPNEPSGPGKHDDRHHEQPDHASEAHPHEPGERNEDAALADQPQELSIEQQLKGALSSFQDLSLTDQSADSHDDDEFGLSQFARMLGSGHTDEPQRSAEQQSPSSKAAESSSKHDVPTDEQTAEKGEQSLSDRAAATSSEPTAELTKHGDESGPSQPEKSSSPSDPKHEESRESLAAKIPPLPAHGGQLPPMPPPPAALTTPTAPLTAEERYSQLSRASQSATERTVLPEETERSETHTSEPKTRLPTAPPSLSENYERSLAEQVEEAKKVDDQPRVPILNDNQAILQARSKTVAVLDSLAAQILEALGCNHYQETLATVTQPNSEKGLAYRLLLDAFEDAKRIFLVHASPSSRHGPEAKPDEVRPFLEQNLPGIEMNRENIITIQRANLATFVAAVFGTIEIGFWELDKWFVQAFVPEGGRLLKQQANIYLDLKTQAYISAVESTTDEEARKAAIDDLFPADLDQKLRDMFGERTMLAPSERDFVEKCKRRRKNIEAEDAKDLSSKYHWVPFLRELSDYIQKNHYLLLPPRQNQANSNELISNAPVVTHHQQVSQVGAPRAVPARRVPPGPSSAAVSSPATETGAQASRRASSARQTARASPSAADVSAGVTHDSRPKIEVQESATNASASRATAEQQGPPDVSEATQPRSDPPSTHPDSARPSTQPSPPNTGDVGESSTSDEPRTTHPGGGERPDLPSAGHPMFPPLPKQVLPPPGVVSSDSQDRSVERARRPGPRPAADGPLVDGPTDTLAAYEAARASAEGTDAVRPRASMLTTRRTWTKEEEEALMKGMDRVQGPYWAQILELYGPGGKISEVLKDRSQVQLKDKARNLKMFFYRLGLPIPAVFQYVTGDYETRKSSGKRIRERKQKANQSQSPVMAPLSAPSSSDTTSRPAPLPQQSQVAPTPAQTGSGSPTLTGQTVSHESQPSTSLQSQQQPPSQGEATDRPGVPNLVPDSTNQNPSQSNDSPTNRDNTDNGNQSAQNISKNLQHETSSGGDQQKPQSEELSSKTGTANESEVHVQVQSNEKVSELSELFPDGDDKEEDINSLLTRVGEFVDNH